MMGPKPTSGPPVHIAQSVTLVLPAALPTNPVQPLLFAPGRHPKEFSALLTNTIANRLTAVFATNQPMSS